MHFTIQREVLLKPLQQVIGVVERRQTLPVLSNLLVVSGSGKVSFTGTDLEVEMSASVDAADADAGEVTIPARKLFDICRALPDGSKYTLSFVRVGLTGPRLDNVPSPSLVLTADWWIFNTGLVALNCPTVPDCPVLFALATNAEDAARLRAAYPGRTALQAVNHDGRIDLEPN